jgi:hypothetical protein
VLALFVCVMSAVLRCLACPARAGDGACCIVDGGGGVGITGLFREVKQTGWQDALVAVPNQL